MRSFALVVGRLVAGRGCRSYPEVSSFPNGFAYKKRSRTLRWGPLPELPVSSRYRSDARRVLLVPFLHGFVEHRAPRTSRIRSHPFGSLRRSLRIVLEHGKQDERTSKNAGHESDEEVKVEGCAGHACTHDGQTTESKHNAIGRKQRGSDNRLIVRRGFTRRLVGVIVHCLQGNSIRINRRMCFFIGDLFVDFAGIFLHVGDCQLGAFSVEVQSSAPGAANVSRKASSSDFSLSFNNW